MGTHIKVHVTKVAFFFFLEKSRHVWVCLYVQTTFLLQIAQCIYIAKTENAFKVEGQYLPKMIWGQLPWSVLPTLMDVWCLGRVGGWVVAVMNFKQKKSTRLASFFWDCECSLPVLDPPNPPNYVTAHAHPSYISWGELMPRPAGRQC